MQNPKLAVSVWNPKGGVGKTTIALNLAGFFASEGFSTCVVDLDPQGGSLTFAGIAAESHKENPDRCPPLPFDVVASQTKPYDVVVFDHPPLFDLHIPAPWVLVPTILDAGSLAPTLRGLQELRAAGKPYMVVPNRYDPKSSQQRAIYKQNYDGLPFIRQRLAFANAYSRGLTIYSETALASLPNVGLAADEFDKVPNMLGDLIQRAAKEQGV